jgi:hypothetical protein
VPRSSAKCNCLHCNQAFVPDHRNRGRQRFCAKADCRRASRRESQHHWLAKPENRDYFRGPENTARVRAWREAHPGYARNKKGAVPPLQDTCLAQGASAQPLALIGPLAPLQDLCQAQEPLLVGLVSSFIDSALQEDIAGHLRRLIARGREILGHNAPAIPDSS